MKTLIKLVIVTTMLATLSACVAAPPYGNAYYGNSYYAGAYRSHHHHHGGWRHRW
jgi:hypothetical protein